jgi:competence protein ComEC
MSFAAVTAIITLHSTGWAKRHLRRHEEWLPTRLARGVAVLVATGLAVEAALVPIALYHFHKAGLYSVAANVIAIPLTTFVVMPLEAGALLLDSIGLGAPLWFLTGVAIDVLLGLAHAVASARGSVVLIASMPTWSYALMLAGGLWFCLWTSRARLMGLLPFALGALFAAIAPRPDVLVTGDGRHLALITADGTPLLLRERSGDFVREMIAESSAFDGDPDGLSSHPFASCSRDSCVAVVQRAGRQWQILATRSSVPIEWHELVRACAQADIVVSDRWLPRGCTPRWLKLDRRTLGETGGVAIYLDGEPRVETVSERVGKHPWAS